MDSRWLKLSEINTHSAVVASSRAIQLIVFLDQSNVTSLNRVDIGSVDEGSTV